MKKIICLIILSIGLSSLVYSQSGVENRYYVSYKLKQYSPAKEKIGLFGCNKNLWYSTSASYYTGNDAYVLYSDQNGYAPINRPDWPREMPKKFRIYGLIGEFYADAINGSKETDYKKGVGVYELDFSISKKYGSNCKRSLTVKGEFTVDDPVEIEKIWFSGHENDGVVFLCEDQSSLNVKTGKYYKNNMGNPELQIFSRNNTWEKIYEINKQDETFTFSHETITKYVDLGRPIQIRTMKKMLDGGYSKYTAIKHLYYLPKFEFPQGTKIEVEYPACKGDKPWIRIPYSDSINYNITINNITTGGTGGNVDTKNLSKSGGYYILTADKVSSDFSFSAGKYKLFVEYKQESCSTCPCFSTKEFEIYDIPNFTVSTPVYENEITDDRGKTYQIRKNGGEGKVSFTVTDSKSKKVYVRARKKGGGFSYSAVQELTGTSNTVGETTYYSGNVSINLKAGTYNEISVYNESTISRCYSYYADNNGNNIEIALNEPDKISFGNPSATSPSCNKSGLKKGDYQNGKITLLNITGGIGTLNYSLKKNTITVKSGTISGSGFSKTEIPDLEAGTYQLTISDNSAYGNSTAQSVKIDAPPVISVNLTDLISPTLSCSSDGSVRVEATGGCDTFIYSKEFDKNYSDNNVVEGYPAWDNNKVYIQDDCGCVVEKSFGLVVEDALAVDTIMVESPTCHGDDDGSCTIVMKNVNGVLSVFNPPTDSLIITGDTIKLFKLSKGGMDIHIFDTDDDYSCPYIASIKIEDKDIILIETTTIEVGNKGTATGQISVSVSGGNPGNYTVSLYADDLLQQQVGNSQVTTDDCSFIELEGHAYGKTYTVLVIDEKGCTMTQDVTVFEPAGKLNLIATLVKPVSCYSNSDATIELRAEGGWDYYEYYSKDSTDWTTNTVFTGYPAGIHSFYVRDKWNGMDSVHIQIGQPLALEIERDSISHVLCYSGSDGLLRYRVSGGTYPYKINTNAGTVTESIADSDTLLTIKGLKSGEYEFTVTDARGCFATALKDTIIEPGLLEVAVLSIIQPTCELDNGALSVKATGGTAPYAYILENVDTEFPHQQTQDNVNAGDTVCFYDLPNRYNLFSVTVIDNNGCSKRIAYYNTEQYINPYVGSVKVNDLICYGQKNGQIEVLPAVTSKPVQDYTLYNADTTYTETNTTGIFEELYAGEYWIDLYDENGCKSNIPYKVTVGEPEVFAISIDTIMPVINKGEKDGKVYLRVEGGAEGCKIIRLKDTDDVVVDSISVVNNLQFYMPVAAGTYYMEINDNQTCSVTTGTFVVDEPDEALRLIITGKEDASCKSQTGRIVVEGAGGWGDYRFKRISEGQFSTLNHFENLYPGDYLIEVTDKMGAVYRESIVIYEPLDSLRAEVTGLHSPTCRGNGGLSIKISGGTAPYTLRNNLVTEVYTAAGIVLWQGYESGQQSFYLTDANGCHFELETYIPETTLLKIERFELKHPSMAGEFDGSIRAFVTGGIAPYTYKWERSFWEPLDDDTDVLEDIGYGYYSLIVADSGGCSIEEAVYLAEPDDLPFEIIDIIHESSYKAANGQATIYADTNLTEIAIISPQKAIYEFINTDVTTHFKIENDTIYLSNLESGKWHIIGASSGEKQYVGELIINAYPEFVFSHYAVTHVAAKGDATGRIKVEIKGGGGENQFTWTNSQSEPLTSIDDEYGSRIENLPAGTYTVTVEDKYGNQITKSIEVQEPAEKLTISLVDKKDQDCKDYEDAWVIVSANGGWGDYQFRHDAQTYYNNGSTFTNLPTRDNLFYLIDKMGAVDSIKVQITEPEYLRASVVSVDSVKCKDNDDGSILFNITGGTPPYRFKELDGTYWIEGNHALNRSEGWYTYIFTDSHNCIGQDTLKVYVPEPDSLLFRDIQVTHTTCELDNGKIVVSLQGGTRPYSYSWLDYLNVEIGTDSIITDLKQNGVYTLNVVDANGCTQQFTQLINPSTLPRVLQVETTEVLCYGDTTGTARVTDFIPGVPFAPYTFTWSNGDTGDYSARFEKGTHHVTIADENGCSTTYYFEITEPDSLYLNFVNVTEPQCYGYGNGYIGTETFGGKGQYSYLWSTGATTPYIEHLFKGDYWVELTDENDCYFRKEIFLDEPEYKTLDLGEDISMCPGNTVVIDGQDFVSHRWFTSTGDVSTQRYLSVTKEGHYFLEATDENGCSVWSDIYVSVGNHALIADMLLPSLASVGDTLDVLELSNMELDSIVWMYDNDVFERVYVDNEYNLPYMAQFKCLQEGMYNIGLYAYAGGCYSPVYKQIEIVAEGENMQDGWGAKEPLIISLLLHPNPTNGEFTVNLELREAAEVNLTLFEIASGICINQRTEHCQKTNRIEYNLANLNTGAYALIVTAGNERKQVKIIIK